MEYAGKQKRFGDCCICGIAVDRQKRTLILGPTQSARSVMKSLKFFLKEERNEDIDDTRLKSLSEKDHICHSCGNRIVKYEEYTNKRRGIVDFLDRHIPRRKSVKLEVTPISPHTRPASTTEQPRSTALSMCPNDHDPPPAPTDVPHSQSGNDELSAADVMRNSSLELVTNMAQAAGGHLTHTGCPPPLQNANSGSAQIPTGGPGSIPGGHEPGAARSGQSRQLQPAAQVADQQGGDPTLSSQDDVHDLINELLNNAERFPCATLLPSSTAATSQSPPVTKMVPEPASVPLTNQQGHAHQHPSSMMGQVYMAQAADALSHTGYPPPHQPANSGSAQTPTRGTDNIPGGQMSVVNPANTGLPISNGVPGAAGSGWSRQLQPAAQVAEQDAKLSDADKMWNPKQQQQQQQPLATLVQHTPCNSWAGDELLNAVDEDDEDEVDEVLHKFLNSGNTQTPTGGPGSIPGGHEPHPQGVVTSPTSYPTPQYHTPAPTAGVSPHHQQYYIHEMRRPQGHLTNAQQQQQTVQMYQQRRMGEGHPAHQQYLATAHQQQQHAAVVATPYQREQFAATQQQQHQHERMASHHHMQFSNPAYQENMGVQSVPMASSLHDVMTQSAPMNCTQPTCTMQQQLEREYVPAQGHAPQVQMMAQAHEAIYQHTGMGQQVLQPLQTGGQHGYQTVDGCTHMLQAEQQQQQQLYVQTQQSSFGSHFGVGGHPRRVLYTSGEKRGVPSDLAAYDHEVAAKQMVIAHPQGMMGVPQAPVQQMVQQPVGMVQHAAGMVQHAAGMTQHAAGMAQQTCTILHTSQC